MVLLLPPSPANRFRPPASVRFRPRVPCSPFALRVCLQALRGDNRVEMQMGVGRTPRTLLPAAFCCSFVRHLLHACLSNARIFRDYGLLCKSVQFFFACGALRDDLPHRLRRAKGRDFWRPRRVRALLISRTARRAPRLCARFPLHVLTSCSSPRSTIVHERLERLHLHRGRPAEGASGATPAVRPRSARARALFTLQRVLVRRRSGSDSGHQWPQRATASAQGARGAACQARAVAYLQTGARPCQ